MSLLRSRHVAFTAIWGLNFPPLEASSASTMGLLKRPICTCSTSPKVGLGKIAWWRAQDELGSSPSSSWATGSFVGSSRPRPGHPALAWTWPRSGRPGQDSVLAGCQMGNTLDLHLLPIFSPKVFWSGICRSAKVFCKSFSRKISGIRQLAGRMMARWRNIFRIYLVAGDHVGGKIYKSK